MKKSKLNQVGNYGKLVNFINAQGPVYNPSKASIKVVALQTLLTQAQGIIKAADVSQDAYENAMIARQAVFRAIPQLSSRIIAALQASGAKPEVFEDAMEIRRRFTSQPKKARVITSTQAILPDGKEEEVKYQRKISQLDRDSLIGNFQRLVVKVTSEPLYKPNEADLKPDAITAYVATLREKNDAVIKAFIAVRDVNQAADNILFGNGIYEQAKAAKAYIKSLFGNNSAKHKEVRSIAFRKK